MSTNVILFCILSCFSGIYVIFWFILLPRFMQNFSEFSLFLSTAGYAAAPTKHQIWGIYNMTL